MLVKKKKKKRREEGRGEHPANAQTFVSLTEGLWRDEQ
jgi:hypothetical protein